MDTQLVEQRNESFSFDSRGTSGVSIFNLDPWNEYWKIYYLDRGKFLIKFTAVFRRFLIVQDSQIGFEGFVV